MTKLSVRSSVQAALILSALLILPRATVAQETSNNPYKLFRSKTYDVQATYLDSVAQHQMHVMKDLERKLEQQRWQTNAIAIMVFVMVVTGLCLSYMQFRRDAKSSSQSPISLKLGSGSIEFSSSVIGLSILIMSFWFFQVYIDRVYKVEVFPVAPIDVTTFGINR